MAITDLRILLLEMYMRMQQGITDGTLLAWMRLNLCQGGRRGQTGVDGQKLKDRIGELKGVLH
ncbi:MAG: hypothetical protein G8237_09630 [Magnetococcales bacterium]|nr:hypothetical protein [Magnetococcales bacterium]NGZ06605.1 hypothetical protein [Magnetococcales bacterium]